MRFVVIGCGLIGLTTAYFLKRSGHDVTVIDRQEGPGRETSFANASLLTPSMSEPWNAPGSWRVLAKSLGRSDAALQLRWRALPSLVGWGIRFLRNSHPEIFHRNTLHNLQLAAYSLKVMATLRTETGVDYEQRARGSLRIFRNRATLDKAVEAAAPVSAKGVSFQNLSTTEVVDLEPALKPIARQLSGGLYNAIDETGDAFRFCVALTEICRCEGVEFLFGTTVGRLDVRRREVVGLITTRGRLTADQYLVAAGSYSTRLLREAGIHCPVRPAKGYSVTYSGDDSQTAVLSIPIVDDDWHAAIVPHGTGIRVGGTAEFAGYDLTLDKARVQNLDRLAHALLPEARLKDGRPWCGLRPMSVDGVPRIGITSIRNLWLSTGHGHLGWTMAAGSARLLSDLASGRSPEIDPMPYNPERPSQT